MTGGNRGIGLHILEKLLKCEMTVLLGVRNPEASRNAVEEALGIELTENRVFYEQCDTGDMTSVRLFSKKVQQKFSAVHLLINNGEKYLKSLLTLICYYAFLTHFSWRHVHTIQGNQRWFRIPNGY